MALRLQRLGPAPGNRVIAPVIGTIHRSIAVQKARNPPQVQARCSSDRTMADLEAELNLAISEENYTTAARLRDQLSNSKHDNRVAVEEAQRKFYTAFEKGDLDAMDAIWGEGEHVQCIHPQAGCIAGKSDVMASWTAVLAGAKRGLLTVSISDIRTVASDTQAFCTCLETVDAGDSRGRVIATNVFEKQDGRWKIVHHHGSSVPFV